jgi:hypothetical protein
MEGRADSVGGVSQVLRVSSDASSRAPSSKRWQSSPSSKKWPVRRWWVALLALAGRRRWHVGVVVFGRGGVWVGAVV